MNGASVLRTCLERVGINRVYGLIGTTIVAFVDSFHGQEKVRYISTRHEQVAGGMADVEARITGKPGVAAVHAGPGLLQAAIAIADAYKDCSPCLFIAGTVRRRLKGRDGFVEIDAEKVFASMTNGVFRASSAMDLPVVFKAAYEATFHSGGGPVILEVPEDVWQEEAEAEPLDPQPPYPVKPSGEVVEKASELFRKGQRKAILLGAGSKNIEREKIMNFAREHEVPLLTTVNGRGIVDEKDDLVFGPCGFAAQNSAADKVFQTSDVLLCLGCTISDMTSYQYTSPLPEQVIVVNISEKAEQVFPGACFFVQADADAFFSAFLESYKSREPQSHEWLDSLKQNRQQWRAQLAALASIEKTPLSASFVLQKLYPLLPRDFVCAGGAGLHVTYAINYLPVQEKNSFFMAHNFGSMGFCFPSALGAKVVMPDRLVLCVIGDGDFMMTVQDLETAVRENIEVLVLVINDFSYRALTATQKLMFSGRVIGSQHGNPDFAKVAESFGARGFTIKRPEEVVPTFEKALSDGGVRVVDIQIDPDDPAPLNLEAVLRLKSA